MLGRVSGFISNSNIRVSKIFNIWNVGCVIEPYPNQLF